MDGQISFIFEQRQPIKGYPELHWTGKRPYTSTQYYPAQLKESYGEPNHSLFIHLVSFHNLSHPTIIKFF